MNSASHVAWRAGTIPYNPNPSRFLAPIDCLKIPAQILFDISIVEVLTHLKLSLMVNLLDKFRYITEIGLIWMSYNFLQCMFYMVGIYYIFS